jgi:hypothetical protein
MKRRIIWAFAIFLTLSTLPNFAHAAERKFQAEGCHSKVSASLQLKDGTAWKDVIAAQGWELVASCPAATPYEPWAMADIAIGTTIRWHIYAPGAWDFYTNERIVEQEFDHSNWQQLENVPNHKWGVMMLMTDGRILVEEEGTGGWWGLTPNDFGDYSAGTWKQLATMPANHKPTYYASAVLPDGRVIIAGGEYNATCKDASRNCDNLVSIYDPVSDIWTAVTPPNGGAGEWGHIGDSPSVVLANGTFMLGNQDHFAKPSVQALLNASSLTWTITGSGFQGVNEEAGFTLLPNDKVLYVDTRIPSTGSTEIYNSTTGSWTSAGLTPSLLTTLDPITRSFSGQGISEMGPTIVMPNGLVLAVGASQNTAIYDSTIGKWSAGPKFPNVNGVQYAGADNNAVVLPSGNVLLTGTIPPKNTGPSHFFIYDGTTISQTSEPLGKGAVLSSPYGGEMLGLPTGQVLWNAQSDNRIFLYTPPNSSPNISWSPIVTSVPTDLSPKGIYTLSGKQLNGVTTGSFEGDERQNSTNYPLVQITNNATGKVSYARTFDIGSFSIAPNNVSAIKFQVSSDITRGSSTLRVIASGFASLPVTVTVNVPLTEAEIKAAADKAAADKAAADKAAADKAAADKAAADKAAAVKKLTIACIKGKTVMKITAIKPTCPSGYRKKV